MKKLLASALCLVLSVCFMMTSALASYEAHCGIAKEGEDWIVNFKGSATGNGNVHEYQIKMFGEFQSDSSSVGVWSDLYNDVFYGLPMASHKKAGIKISVSYWFVD